MNPVSAPYVGHWGRTLRRQCKTYIIRKHNKKKYFLKIAYTGHFKG